MKCTTYILLFSFSPILINRIVNYSTCFHILRTRCGNLLLFIYAYAWHVSSASHLWCVSLCGRSSCFGSGTPILMGSVLHLCFLRFFFEMSDHTQDAICTSLLIFDLFSATCRVGCNSLDTHQSPPLPLSPLWSVLIFQLPGWATGNSKEQAARALANLAFNVDNRVPRGARDRWAPHRFAFSFLCFLFFIFLFVFRVLGEKYSFPPNFFSIFVEVLFFF